MNGTRTPLYNREQPNSLDVSDALTRLLDRHQRRGGVLPVAYSKEEVVDRLVYMANTGSDGVYVKPTTANRRALYELYMNRITSGIVFQSGYKNYEKDSKLSVVPVNEFFLQHVLTRDKDTGVCLSSMVEFDIQHSLPKRNSIPVNDGKPYVHSGQIAGIVIFPKDYDSELLRYWLGRRVKTMLGSINGTSIAVEHAAAAPDMERVRYVKGQLESTFRQVVSNVGRHRVLIESD